MPADTEPDPTPDQPFQYSLRTLLLIMTGLCVSFGLMKWNPVVGVLSVGAGSLVIAVWMSRRNPLLMERLVAIIVIIAIVVNGFLLWPCVAIGLACIGSQDRWLLGLRFLSVALGVFANMFTLMVASRARVRLLSTIAFAANGYLFCLAQWLWLKEGDAVLPAVTLFFTVHLNVIALSLAVACRREANRMDV